MRMLCVAVLALVATVSPALGQTPGDRQKARLANKAGWDYMKAESFDKAVKEFQQSIEFDPTFEMSFYGLGRALQIQEYISLGYNMTITSGVPAWVSLSLGSALFRSGKLADAETEYKAAVSADPRSGEAHNNLAVVYLETERFNDALASINAAKKTGFKVNPELEKAVRERAK